MADTTLTGGFPGLTDVALSTTSSEITIPRGVRSVALLEEVTNLEVSYDETTWATPAETKGLVVWSSRKGDGGTVHLRLSTGSGTYPLLTRDHI